MKQIIKKMVFLKTITEVYVPTWQTSHIMISAFYETACWNIFWPEDPWLHHHLFHRWLYTNYRANHCGKHLGRAFEGNRLPSRPTVVDRQLCSRWLLARLCWCQKSNYRPWGNYGGLGTTMALAEGDNANKKPYKIKVGSINYVETFIKNRINRTHLNMFLCWGFISCDREDFRPLATRQEMWQCMPIYGLLST